MALRRMLSRSLGCSEKFTAVPGIAGNGLGEFAQLLYCLMIPHADDYGRLRDGAKGIKLAVLPDSARPVGDFEWALLILATAGLIIRYESKGDQVIQITRFAEEQPGLRLDRAAKPRWDDPPEISKEISITGNIPAVPGSAGRTEGKGTELKGREEKGREENTRTAPAALDVRFDSFWSVYPKKVGKEAARRRWRKLHPSDALTDAMIAAVKEQRQSAQWQKNHGQYIPNPDTWLNQGRWQDELPTEAADDWTPPKD